MAAPNQFTAGWSDSEIDALRELVSTGRNNLEIAVMLGRSERSIAVKKSKLGITISRDYKRFDDKEWLFQKYVNEGYSTTDIAEMTGVHFATIAKWLRKHGIPARAFHAKSTRHRKKISVKLKKNRLHNHPKWKGGKTKTREGYIYVKVENHPFSNANGSVLEHRLVLEKLLGRFLTREEVVHHLNEIKDDNRIENLFLFATGRDHKHFHEQRHKNSDFPMLYKYDYLHKEIV